MQSIFTSDDLRETKEHGIPDFPLQYYVDDTREFYNNQINWHWHNEFEIVYVSEGTVTCHIDKQTFTVNAGEAIFINSGVLHEFTSESYGLMPNIVFSPIFIAPLESIIYKKYVDPLKKSTLPYYIFKRNTAWQGEVLDLLKILFSFLESKNFNELRVKNILSEIWLIFMEYIKPSLIEKENFSSLDLSYSSVPLMIQYIQSHYGDNIGLEDISAVANISKNTAIRYFNAKIGMSPVDYLIKYRISMACKLLKETSYKITHISAAVGYTNTSYFCRLFKKVVGLSPNEYRNS